MSPVTMKLLVPCLLLLVTWSAWPSLAQMSRDGLALLQIKSNITLDPYGFMAEWNASDNTPCRWRRVTCVPSGIAPHDSLVSKLDLQGYLSSAEDSLSGSLEGSVSASLGILVNLTFLDLSMNRLNGSIPASMSRLQRLIHLDLSKNALSGPIFPALGGLANLVHLDLSSNGFSGDTDTLGLARMTKLETLGLDGNHFTGSLPNMSAYKNLVRLRFDGNLTGGKIPDLSASRNLEELVMRGAQLEGPFPGWVHNMPNLTNLDLSWNDLGGELSSRMWSTNTSLRHINLSGNQIGGAIPEDFLKLFPKNYEELQGDFQGPGNFLNLSNNRLAGNIPARVDGSALRSLDLRNNELDGPIPTWMISSSKLMSMSLYLQNNRLHGDIPSFNWSGARLDRLELQSNRLSGNVGPATWQCWTHIAYLDLSHNSGVHLVNGSLELMVTNSSNLQKLYLSNIGSSGRLSPSARTATGGTIDSVLEVLDLSHSNLEGDLSLSIFADAHLRFPRLRSLNLSGNRLTGLVPPGMAFMPAILVLDLSNNCLSGPLPFFPPNLLNASFFAGNPGLCGSPLKPYKQRSRDFLVLPLSLTLVSFVLLSAAGCVFFGCRLRKSNLRHKEDAELIAAMQGKNSASLMPLAELRKATSNFSKESQIGVGGFGTVHKGRLNDGSWVAIKRSKRQGSQQDKEQFLNEVNILSHVNHRNLVRLLGCCLENKVALLVFEYVPSGTLKEHLRKPAVPLTWEQRMRIALHTAEALAYLHSAADPPIFHRDVKSANILLDRDLNAKVADFGISKLVPVEVTHVSTKAVQGTMGYIDPEYYTGFKLSAKSDVYSFGVVLLELISAQAAIDFGRDPEEAALSTFAVSLICKGDLQEIVDPAIAHTFDSDSGKECIDGVAALAVKCLQPRSRNRPSMKEVSKELQGLWLPLEPTVLTLNDDDQQGSGPIHSEQAISIDGAFMSEASILASYGVGR